MATIKSVSSKQSIGGAIDYVTKKEKTEEKLISGINCTPEVVKEEMQATKLIWNKTDGRTYKHYVQSFHADEKITHEQAHEIALELAKNTKSWQGHEVLVATHKDRDHIHTHFIINSVNKENGYKLHESKHDLQDLKDRSDQLCLSHGLSVTVKGKTFHGEEREETSAFKKETYQLLKKAEAGEVKSYVQDIALKIMEVRENAVSRQDFIDKMNMANIHVQWSDNRKYITFTDKIREAHGESKCKIRNNKLEKYYNIDFSKEGLERGFEINVRRQETIERAKQQLSGTRTEAIGQDHGIGTGNAESLIRELNAKERAAAEKRKIRENERKRLDLDKQRKADERKFKTRTGKTKSSSRDR